LRKIRPDLRVRYDPLWDRIEIIDWNNIEFQAWRNEYKNEGRIIPDKFITCYCVEVLLNYEEQGEELWNLIQQKGEIENRFSSIIKELLEKEDEISNILKKIMDIPSKKVRHIIKLKE
jgi:hypothetical protein